MMDVVGIHKKGDTVSDWVRTFEAVRPHAVMIEDSDPKGKRGSGFFCGSGSDFAVVATAAHVIESAKEQHLPIRITHPFSKSQVELSHDHYQVEISQTIDLALITVSRKVLPWPDKSIPLTQITHPPGHQVGWCGFPVIAEDRLCFFSGFISAHIPDECYYVDGVAIHGVSGGPVFHWKQSNGIPVVIGIVTNYRPNKQKEDAEGELLTLPGLSVVISIHKLLDKVRTRQPL